LTRFVSSPSWFVFLFLIVAALSPALAQDDDAAAFFRGKTLRIVVGVGVGSGYDINARLLARHMASHISGTPGIIVQNQPGAGSLAMTNALYNNGPFDGSVIGASFNGMPAAPLLAPAGARFDPVKINWLGSTNRETQVMYVWHSVPAHSLDDAKSREIIMGAQAPGSTQFDYPVLANRLLGFKFKVVTGYESTPKIHLAMESGEVDGTIANWSTLKAINANWITQKKVRMLTQWALTPNPELAGVPLIIDVARSDAERAALKLMLARLEYGRPFFLPPNVPAARVDALRRAFDATMRDAAYLADAERLKIDIDPLSGEEVAALIAQVLRTPPDTVAKLRTALEQR
jgi:tripartite-type tricarboxylate transporter receptor subunit TctC